ncbi:hypothetical protein U1Q18_003201 [Sarracenia purpurea var. burkii]
MLGWVPVYDPKLFSKVNAFIEAPIGHSCFGSADRKAHTSNFFCKFASPDKQGLELHSLHNALFNVESSSSKDRQACTVGATASQDKKAEGLHILLTTGMLISEAALVSHPCGISSVL